MSLNAIVNVYIYVAMQKQSIPLQKGPFNHLETKDSKVDCRAFAAVTKSLLQSSFTISYCLRENAPLIVKDSHVVLRRMSNVIGVSEVKVTANENIEELSDEDDEACPVECVREFKTDNEFLKILEKANKTNSLVVVDFYRTSCGSCKYIEQGFKKLCKGSGDQSSVIFLKHNVIDEYDEQSEVAERLRIKTVPLFQFYKNGVLLEAFPTRDKERIVAAISKYSDISPRES